MKHLADLPSQTLLDWWRQASPGEEYDFPCRMAATLGYQVSLKVMRREIKKRLKQENLLPSGRPLQSKDYQAARAKVAQRREDDLS